MSGRNRYHHGDAQYARQHPCNCDLCSDAIERARLKYVRLPIEPLVALAPPWVQVNSGYAAMGGINGTLDSKMIRRWHRSKSQGWITFWAADTLACALGYHPAEVWGDDWWEA